MGAIGVEKAHICGHSYGGGIAQWMVLDQRMRVDRLALVSPGGLGRGVISWLRLMTFPFFGPQLTPIVLRYAMPSVLRYWSDMFGHMEPDEIKRFLSWTMIPGSARSFQRTVEGVINLFGQYMQTFQRICEVQDIPPIFVFWGTDDPIIPTSHGKDALKRFEGITLTLYERCNHYPHLEVPDQFAADLVKLLTDPDRGPVRVPACSL